MRLTSLLAAVLLLAACKHVPDEEDMQRASYSRDLGSSALGRRDYRGALEELQKAERIYPEDAETHYALGLVYFTGFNRLKEAEQHLRRAVELREKYSDAENALGNVLMAKGECDKAIPYFERAMSNLLWATPYIAQMNLGWCLHKVGRTPDGIKELRAAVNIHPPLCGGYDYLARIHAEINQETEAVRWMEKFLEVCDTEKLRPSLPPGMLASTTYHLGLAYYRAGDRDQARTMFATCLERFGQEEVGAECRKNLSLME